MRWTVKEYEISEHSRNFILKLPKNYQILSVLIKGSASVNNPMAGAPCLYIRYPEGEKETEEVVFTQVEDGTSVDGSLQFVGSYQERGYHKIKHLFAEVILEVIK
jgi:hypothetical protein